MGLDDQGLLLSIGNSIYLPLTKKWYILNSFSPVYINISTNILLIYSGFNFEYTTFLFDGAYKTKLTWRRTLTLQL